MMDRGAVDHSTLEQIIQAKYKTERRIHNIMWVWDTDCIKGKSKSNHRKQERILQIGILVMSEHQNSTHEEPNNERAKQMDTVTIILSVRWPANSVLRVCGGSLNSLQTASDISTSKIVFVQPQVVKKKKKQEASRRR